MVERLLPNDFYSSWKYLWEGELNQINGIIFAQIYKMIFNRRERNLREKMAQAYEFALDKVGMDMHSYSIYSDYISFLKSAYVLCFPSFFLLYFKPSKRNYLRSSITIESDFLHRFYLEILKWYINMSDCYEKFYHRIV